jgi:hypothetical protein
VRGEDLGRIRNAKVVAAFHRRRRGRDIPYTVPLLRRHGGFFMEKVMM